MIKNKTQRPIGRFLSDGGGEYTSNSFKKLLREDGTKQEFTIPDTPAQNGVSERVNQTLLDGVRCLLRDGGS